MAKEVYRYRQVVPVILYLLAVFFLAYVTEEPITLVLLGMMPALVNLFVLIYFDPNQKENHLIVILSPVVLSFIFLFIWKSAVNPTLTGMDGPTVAFLNVILGYFMMLFFITWRKDKKIVKVIQSVVRPSAQPEVRPTVQPESRPTVQRAAHNVPNVSKSDEYKKQAEEAEERAHHAQTQSELLKQKIAQYEHALRQTHAQSKESQVQSQVQLQAQLQMQLQSQVEPLKQMIMQYQVQVERDQKELQKLKSELLKYEIELSSTQQDEYRAKSQLKPLKEALDQYQNRVDTDNKELERLRGLVSQYAHELHSTRKEVQQSIRSIEDKCKAINFVIGRVYADKKGGSPEIRELIQIPRELYNMFSEILQDPKKEDKKKLQKVVKLILQRLENLEHREATLFKVKKARVPVNRKSTDTILEVLAKNDQDPVTDFHTEAKMVCNKLLEYLK